MSLSTKEKQKLRKFIIELESIRGRHTELVSVYIPADYDLNKIINHLQQEQGTASNIKDAKTRNNVIDSLEKAIRHLRLFKRTPKNGLAVFAGNVAAQEGKVDLQIWSIEPPEPLRMRLYRCDQTFILDYLKEMLEVKEVYGLIVIDRREAALGLLKGTSITVLNELTSAVPGKTRAGGQSSQRFERLREGAAKEFFKRIAEYANKEFLDKPNLKGLLIGGPGPTKEEFIHYLNNELKKKIIAVQDITYTDAFGLHNLVDKSKDVLAKEIIIEEKELMTKFFELLAKTPEKVAYGKKEVEQALQLGAVEILLLSESLDGNLIESYEIQAEKTNSTIQIISIDTREGQQLRDIGGIAAILRFPINI